MKTVEPLDFEGFSMSIMQFFGSGPKFKIKCGGCGLWFSQRIMVVSRPPAKCPYCNAVNILPVEADRM